MLLKAAGIWSRILQWLQYNVYQKPFYFSTPVLLIACYSVLHIRSLRMMPGKGNIKKYPQIKPSYESRGTRGLFVLGTASHSVDFRKSAGGFIHGFRYTSKYWGVQKGQRWKLFLPSKEQTIDYCWKEIGLNLVLAVKRTKHSQAAAALSEVEEKWLGVIYEVCGCLSLFCLVSLLPAVCYLCNTIDFSLPDTLPRDRLWVRGLCCGVKTQQLWAVERISFFICVCPSLSFKDWEVMKYPQGHPYTSPTT